MNIFKLFKRKPKEPAWKALHPTWKHDRSAAGRKAMETSKFRYGRDYASRIAVKGGEATARKRRAA